MVKRKNVITAAVTGVLFFAIAGAVATSDVYFLIKKNFTLFSEVYKEVSLNYVDEINPEKLMRKGIDSMLETLDPYTVFIDEAQSQDMDIITRGSYGGVGMEVGFKGDKIVVIAPMEGYPAHRKGIRAGDVIIAVDGVDVQDLSPDEVQDMTVGEPGSAVTISIDRYGEDQPLEFELVRERIDVKNIAYSGLVGDENNIGYIVLTRFSQNAAEEVRNAINQLKKQSSLEGLIIDLRNNPGGLLNEAVGTVDKFVEPGVKVVETRGRLSEHNNEFRTSEPVLAGDLSLVILQNGGSASASEIVAGALQDLDRAVIVGERSFGKGLVQIVRPLSYNTALKITTSRYYIPSGRSIQSVTYTHDEENTQMNRPDSLRKAFKTKNGRTVYDGKGIAPDIEVLEPKPTLLETALLQNSHFFFFANQYVANHQNYEANRVSDQLYSDFKSYLESKDFDFETAPERYLGKMKESLVSGEPSGDLAGHLSQIEQVIEQEKEKAFSSQQEQLKRTLFLELVTRYKGISGRYAASAQFDPVIREAIKVISQPERYQDILAMKN